MSSKKLCVLFFSAVLLMIIPSSADGAFTYESCMPENGKTKMMKNNDESRRIYCVTLETAEKLKERGWGTFDHEYFFAKLHIFGGHPFRGYDDKFFIVDFQRQMDIFNQFERDCMQDLPDELEGSFSILCFANFSNSTVLYSPSFAGENSVIEGLWAKGYVEIMGDNVTYYFENIDGTSSKGNTISLELYRE